MTGPTEPAVPRGWHAATGDLAAYAAGTCPPVVTASLEAHLLRCADCRTALAAAGGDAATERRWTRLADAVDRPTPTVVERLTRRSGRRAGSHGLGRTVVAVPAMRWSLLAAVVLVAGIPVLVAGATGTGAVTLLLALGPLAPAGAVALAYRDVGDPAGEITLATPSAGLRLVVVRSALVSLVATPLGIAAALLAGLPLQPVLAWPLPGLALAAIVLLAGTTRLDPLPVLAVAGGAWAVAVVVPAQRAVAAVVETVAAPAVQGTAVAVAVAALMLTVHRRDAVAYRRTA